MSAYRNLKFANCVQENSDHFLDWEWAGKMARGWYSKIVENYFWKYWNGELNVVVSPILWLRFFCNLLCVAAATIQHIDGI